MRLVVRIWLADARYQDRVARRQPGWCSSGKLEYARAIQSNAGCRRRGTGSRPGRQADRGRSGGHCFEDFVDNPDVKILIDLSIRRGTSTTVAARSRGAGATLADVYQALYDGWGVTLPGGSCPTVGVGGHVAGGGYGPLSRRHGSSSTICTAWRVIVVDSPASASWSPPGRPTTPTAACGGRTPAVAAATSAWSPAI